MPRIETDADDPRLSPFAKLQHRAVDSHFVTEGRTATARLIASRYPVAAVVTDRNDDAVTAGLDRSVPVYRLSRTELSRLVGFRFHRGVLGLGQRLTSETARSAGDLLRSAIGRSHGTPLVLGLIGVSDPDNVGSLLRSAACLGVTDILINPQTIDPFGRRVTRVSMGHNLSVRFHQTEDAVASIRELRADGWDVLASTPAPDAVDVNDLVVRRPTVLLVGHEGDGLASDVLAAASHRVRIAMPPGPDSLNVAVAGAVLMHSLRRGQF